MSKIIACSIGPYPTGLGLGQKMPEVKVVFSDGQEKVLFSFFPDELSFDEAEFIGLTEKEARQLHLDKDVAYLQS